MGRVCTANQSRSQAWESYMISLQQRADRRQDTDVLYISLRSQNMEVERKLRVKGKTLTWERSVGGGGGGKGGQTKED